MGLVIKAALGALVVLLIGVLAKTRNYYIAGADPTLPDLCVNSALYCRLRTRHGSIAYDYRVRDVVDHPLFSLSSFALVLHRFYATSPGAERGRCLLGAQRLGAYLLLEPLSLAQRSTAVHGKGSASDIATGEQIIDKIDNLFFTWRNFHQRFI